MSFLKRMLDLFNLSKSEKLTELPEVKPIVKIRKVSEKENTKFAQVKKHLIEKGTIDSWTAINVYGATRLSDIIFKLRERGYNIESIPRTSFDRNKQVCNFTTYKYINDNGVN